MTLFVHRCRRSLALGCTAALIAPAASAQTISGRVRAKGDSSGVAGAIVSLIDSTRHVVAAKLADEAGAFIFSVPAGQYALKAERVGYRSSTSAPFLVRQDETIEVPVTLVAEGISLRAVQVNADRRCVVRPQEGLVTAQLWEEARKALSATQLTQMAQAAARARRDPHRFALRLRKFSRELDPNTLAALHEEEFEVEGEAVTPFVTAAPERLAREGYGAGEGPWPTTYFAPDASILLSDLFLDSHCFRLQAEDDRRDRHVDLVGLGFEPTRLTSESSPDRVEVRGVLWLDRVTAELRFMEYGYVNRRLQTTATRAGGLLEFRPLPDGRWIVWRWYIRAPQIVERQTGASPMQSGGSYMQIIKVFEQGAEVLTVMPAGASRPSRARLRGAVIDSTRGLPMAGVRVFLSGTTYAAETQTDGTYEIDSIPAGKYLASIVAPRLDTLLIDPPSETLTLNAGEQRRVDFAVPGLRTLSTKLCATPMSDSLGILVGIVRDTGATKALGASVRAEWRQFAKQGSDRLSIQPIWNETQAGSGGRYALCGLAPESRLTIHARRGQNSVTSQQPQLRPGEVRRLDLTLKAP